MGVPPPRPPGLHGTCLSSLATQQQNKLIQFPVCANICVLFSLEILTKACDKHIQTRFSLLQFRFWSITQPEILLRHVSVHRVLFD